MPFHLTWEQRENTFGLDGRVAMLANATNRLEVWPALGFNAYRWQANGVDLLYHSPQLFAENRPTRSGWPILFPFPNRIRDGKFTIDGKIFQLPIGDPAMKNAIHGFAVRHPWRVVEHGVADDSAWITGEFQASVDAPETLALWPSDYRLRVTYRLFESVLRVEAEADNPGEGPFPFGLGYHPYFALAPFGGPQAVVTVAANQYWQLSDSLPTGTLLDVDAARDLRHGQTVASLQLDDVMTNLYNFAYDPQDNLGLVGVVQSPGAERILTLWISGDFRELVLFTPPHREAICLEPYTCTTDALNLSQRGIDSGWRVLQPGERWQGIVEVHLSS